MKIKLDENLPLDLARELSNPGHDLDTVLDEGLAGKNDHRVWQASQQAGRFFITQDLDFSDARTFAAGSHSGILLVRLRNPSRGALLERVVELFQSEANESWVGCFVTATERKVRIVRPRKAE